MPYDEDTPPIQPPPIPSDSALTEICDALESALGEAAAGGGDVNPALLEEQAEILDWLFKIIVGKKVIGGFERGYSSAQDWMHFALRTQKQCVDTVKARAAIDYMNKLSAPKPAPASGALPAETVKRTDET